MIINPVSFFMLNIFTLNMATDTVLHSIATVCKAD